MPDLRPGWFLRPFNRNSPDFNLPGTAPQTIDKKLLGIPADDRPPSDSTIMLILCGRIFPYVGPNKMPQRAAIFTVNLTG